MTCQNFTMNLKKDECKTKIVDTLLAERSCCDTNVIDIHTDVRNSGVWFCFWLSELDSVMFQMTVAQVSHSLCVPVGSVPTHPHDACAFFVSETSFILRCSQKSDDNNNDSTR